MVSIKFFWFDYFKSSLSPTWPGGNDIEFTDVTYTLTLK